MNSERKRDSAIYVALKCACRDLARADAARVDVLPFHQMGRFKWRELKLNHTLEGVSPPTIDAVQKVCAQFRGEGLKTY